VQGIGLDAAPTGMTNME